MEFTNQAMKCDDCDDGDSTHFSGPFLSPGRFADFSDDEYDVPLLELFKRKKQEEALQAPTTEPTKIVASNFRSLKFFNPRSPPPPILDRMKNTSSEVFSGHSIQSISRLKKDVFKNTHIPLSKYFRIKRKLKKEKRNRRSLSKQLNMLNQNYQLSDKANIRSISEDVVKLMQKTSLGPQIINTMNRRVPDAERSSDFTCICTNNKSMCSKSTESSELKNLLSSMTPLSPFWQKRISDIFANTTTVNV